MNKESISIYYNSKWGYIAVSDTTLYDSVMRVTIPPVFTEKIDATEVCLGEMALAALENSKNAMPVTREEIEDFNFWQVSGIKGFSAFSRKFQCVEVREKNHLYHVEKLIRKKDGSYVWDENSEGINLDLDCTPEQMGSVIYKMFHEETKVQKDRLDIVSFETVNHHIVKFVQPPYQFQDAGDGNTDAYQIYTYQDDENTYIAFMVDNGYVQVNQQGILNRWKQIYGDIEEFCFKENVKGLMKYVVTAKTQERVIMSYFFEDGDDLLEILLEMNMRLSTEQKIQVNECLENIIKSIKIE